MKNDVKRMSQLIQKLEKEGDIFLEEADWIYSLVSKKPDVFNFDSPAYNKELYAAAELWYKAISKKIKAGQHGNFIFTIIRNKDKDQKINKLTLPAWKAIKKYGNPEDLYNVIVIDEKIYSALPFKHLFTEVKGDENLKSFYKLDTPRAGMYYYPVKTKTGTYTIAQFMKQFSPIENDKVGGITSVLLTTFKIAAGAIEVPQEKFFLARLTIKPYTLATFMRNENISCIVAVDAYDHKVAFFVEKDKMPLVKEAMKVPLEELVDNATAYGIINKEGAKNLLNENYFIHTNFPVRDFVEASAKYVGHVVRRNKEWKAVRKTIEEDEWMMEIR